MSDTTENAAASAAKDEPRPLGRDERRLPLPHRHYEGLIREQIAAWATGEPPTEVEEVLCWAEPDQPGNRLLRDYCKKLGFKAAEFDAGLRRRKAERELGRIPADAQDYVALLAEARGLSVKANVVIDRNERAFTDVDFGNGEIHRCYHAPDEADEILVAYAEHHFRTAPTLSEFALNARATADRLGLGLRRDALNDAVQVWQKKARHRRLEDIKHTIMWTPRARHERAAADEALLRVCRAYNDDGRQSPEYFAAAVRKHIWQTKRKLARMPVTDHAMLILLGAQRGGKSTLVKRLLAPVEELTTPTDFGQITDPRNIELWSSFVLFLDEMSYATKADIDTIKNVITAPVLARKPLYSNGTDHVLQNATLIGCSNKDDLGDLLRDSSGMRRFLAVHVRAQPDWAAAEDADWAAIWRAVDHAAEDPMLPFAEMARERQEEAREKTNVELWLETLGPRSLDGALGEGTRIPAMRLFEEFRAWEEVAFPRSPSSLTRWGRDMASASQQKFQKTRGVRGAEYRWIGGAEDGRGPPVVRPLQEPANEAA